MSKLSFVKREMIIVVSGVIVMMAIGSFYDLSISQALFDPHSPFGVGFSAFGELPYEFSLMFAGFLLLQGGTKLEKGGRVLLLIIGILLASLSAVFAAAVPSKYLLLDQSLSMAIGISIVGVAAAMMYLFIRRCDRTHMIRLAIMILFVAAAQVLMIIVIKDLWGRPRYGFLSGTPGLAYQSWWIIGSTAKDTYVALGAALENFRSFPSGHVGNAACLLMLGFLPRLQPKLSKWQPLFFLIGLIWALLVAVSRIVMGAHFLTDTAASLLITAALYYGVSAYAFRFKRPDPT